MIYNFFEFYLFEGGAIHFLSSPYGLQLASDGRGILRSTVSKLQNALFGGMSIVLVVSR